MGKCVHCGKHGLFLRLNKRGFCQECEQGFIYALYDAYMLHTGVEDYPIPRKLTEDKVMELVTPSIDEALKSLEQSKKYCESSYGPDFFYKHFDNAIREYDYLIQLETLCPDFFGSASPLFSKMQFMESCVKYEARTWLFYSEDIKKKASELKTERGKKNAIQRFVDAVDKYESRINPKSLKAIHGYKHTLIELGQKLS